MVVSNNIFILSILSLSLLSVSAVARTDPSYEQVRVERYTLAKATPSEGQVDLMSVMINITFASEIKTVGQAIQKLISTHGFRLGNISAGSFGQTVLYLLPLPEVHRHLGPMRLQEALRVLGGESFQLVVNPVTREINYEVHDDYEAMLPVDVVIKAKKRWDALLEPQNISGSTALQRPAACPPERLTTYGPVKGGESLSHIALSIKPLAASIEQAMMGLFDANPNAFSMANINTLNRGAVLHVPAEKDILAVNPARASERVREHYRRHAASASLGFLED